MKFNIRFRIKNRWGRAARYTLGEFCVCIVERYSLTEQEIYNIVFLSLNENFENEDLHIRRIK